MRRTSVVAATAVALLTPALQGPSSSAQSAVAVPRLMTAVVDEGQGHSRLATDRILVPRVAQRPRVDTETPTVHQVYAALVVPRSMSLSDHDTGPDDVRRLVRRASDYWASQTGGVVTFEVAEVLPVYRSASGCANGAADVYDMWNEAAERFEADEQGVSVALGVDKHLLVVAPSGSWRTHGCAYGLGLLGTGIHSSVNAAFVADANPSLYAHELGHNLGLNHANAVSCRRRQDSRLRVEGQQLALEADCTATEYDDLLDVMGFSGRTFGEGNLNLPHLVDLGLADDVVETVTPGRTVRRTLRPLSDRSGALRGLRVTDARGTDYYVQYRTASGLDEVATRNPLSPRLGVEILREDPRSRTTGSFLVDASPSGTTAYDRVLRRGAVFHSARGLVRVRVLWAGPRGARVRVVNASSR